MIRNFIFLTLFIFPLLTFAQPANDACANAILIPNVVNFCSANGAGTNVAATDDLLTTGGYPASTCWGGVVEDVWFKFVAIASDVSITIIGNQGSPSSGTLTRPQVSLHDGNCVGTMNELNCGSAPNGQNIIQIYEAGLIIGQTYLIRVDGFNSNNGTFKYCVNNYNPVPAPNSDCNAINNGTPVLCSNSSFTVQSFSSAGNIQTEMNDATCFGYHPIFNPANIESNSSWFKFTYLTSGTVNFDLIPSNPGDDLDFVVYKLINGISNCTGKQVVRCMASSCLGNTGLRPSSIDVSEPSGCAFGQDNYLSTLNVLAGESYAIAINNFTSTGNGYTITFGGTAQIQGPTAIINDNDANDSICINEPITFTDASTPPPTGTITQWTWNFGIGATPATFIGQNPPAITYTTFGTKTISLTVKSDRGCLVTSTKNIVVTVQPAAVSIAANQNNVCPGSNITFTATPTNGGTIPTYQWYLNNVLISTAVSSTYSSSTLVNNDKIKVVLTSNSTCASPNTATSNIINVVILSPSAVNVTISGNAAICQNKSLTLTANPTNGGATPTYQWYLNGNSVGSNSNQYTSTTFANNDSVSVKLTSSLGCVTNNPATTTKIAIKVNPIKTTVIFDTICSGQNRIFNGVAINAAGTYRDTFLTNFSCDSFIILNLFVRTLPNVTVNSPFICSGNTATLTANGALTYTWSGGLGTGNPRTTSVLASTTNYTVTGTDSKGCKNTAIAIVTVNSSKTTSIFDTICQGQTRIFNGNVLTTTGIYKDTVLIGPGCDSVIVLSLKVNPLPNVTVNSPSICAGKTATLTGNGAVTYTWTGGLGSGNPRTTPALNTNTSYTVTGTDAKGCKNTAISNVKVNPIKTTNVFDSICQGQIRLFNGQNLTLAGVYRDTLSTNFSCDSFITLNLFVRALPNVTVNSPSICAGKTATLTANGAVSYTWTGGLGSGNPRTTPVLNTNTSYTVTGTDAKGCKNTALSNVKVNPIKTTNLFDSICQGQIRVFNGQNLTLAGVYRDTLSTNFSCDSFIILNLFVRALPNVTVNSPSICNGKTATLTANGAVTYTWTGGLGSGNPRTTPVLNTNTSYTVTGTDVKGCKNTAISNVTVNPIKTTNVFDSICQGQIRVFNGQNITAAGVYRDTLSTNFSCDSFIILNLFVRSLPTITVNSPSICAGKTATLTANGAVTYTWTGGLGSGNPRTTPALTANTSYTVTGTDAKGCKNTAISNVKVNPIKTTNVFDSICQGQIRVFNGQNLTLTGVYRDTLSTNFSCDSFIILNLFVRALPNVTVNSPSICAGKTATLTANGAFTYTWTGGLGSGNPRTTPVLNTNTSYTVTGTDTKGCKNTAISNVKVNPIKTTNVFDSICQGQIRVFNGQNLITSGVYRDTISTNFSCDSFIILNLFVKSKPTVTVNSPIICAGKTATLTANGAVSYTWSGGLPSTSIVTTTNLNNNQTYTVFGTTNGCKSDVVTSTVTVNPTKITNLTRNICSSDSVVVGTKVFNTSGLHTVVLQTSLGCDSTVNLNLTVNTAFTPEVSITASKNNICKDENVLFTAIPKNTINLVVYQWFLNGNPVGTNSAQFNSTTLNTNDVVSVFIKTIGNCITKDTASSNKITMQVNSLTYTPVSLPYCTGLSGMIDLNVVTNSVYTIFWKNGTDTFTTINVDSIKINNTTPTSIPIQIKFGLNCVKTGNIAVNVFNLPIINAVTDKENVRYEDEVQLNVITNNQLNYNWLQSSNLSNDTIKNPIAVITQDQLFIVHVTDKITGCKNSDSVSVKLINDCTEEFIYVPTGFSPNNDNINDCFSILYPPKLSDFKMVIYNRWGEKVMETSTPTDCWNGYFKGSEAQSDSYVYIISFKCYNGTLLSKQGIVTLLR